MTAIKKRMPQGSNERAKAILDVVISISEGADPETLGDPQPDPERVARGMLGGAKGGSRRASKLTPERRSEIARKAAAARWGGRQP
jgi:hypothetical protein